MIAAILTGLLVTMGISLGDVSTISVEQAVAKLKKDPKIVVVDIRTPEEFASGHIEGAINIDINSDDFAKDLAKLDRKKTYLMHCQSGGRSSASIPVWERLDFEKVLHLSAGTLGWAKEKQPLVVPKEKKD